MMHYILDGKKAVPAQDFEEWLKWAQKGYSVQVGYTEDRSWKVSTIFLGIDHSYGRNPEPALFETMVFGSPLDLAQERYATWEEALAGHAKWVAAVQEAKRQALVFIGAFLFGIAFWSGAIYLILHLH